MLRGENPRKNPRKIRVDQESAGLKDLNLEGGEAWDEPFAWSSAWERRFLWFSDAQVPPDHWQPTRLL